MHLTTFRVIIWCYLTNSVKYIISNTKRLLYKCHTLLESSGQDLSIKQYSIYIYLSVIDRSSLNYSL